MPSPGRVPEQLLTTAIVHAAVLDIRRYARPEHLPEYRFIWAGFGPYKMVRKPLPEWVPAWALADLIHNSVGNRLDWDGVPGWAQTLLSLADSVPPPTREDDTARRLRDWFLRTLLRNGWTYEEFESLAARWRQQVRPTA